jgi:hypothetical protein
MERLQLFLALGRNDEASFLQNQGLTSEVENKGLILVSKLGPGSRIIDENILSTLKKNMDIHLVLISRVQ